MADSDEQVRQPDEAEPVPTKSQDDRIAQMKATVDAMGRQDKMVLFGSVALVILFLLPWYSVTANVMGMQQSNSLNGLQGVAWLGWIAAIAAAVLSLTKAGVLGSMPPAVASAAKSTGVLVVLTGVALLMGPLYFWSKVGGSVPEGAEQIAEFSAGKTFFFFLALLAALAAAGGAAWKLMDERKATGSGGGVGE